MTHMRGLLIDDQARARVRRVRAFAEQPGNYYVVEPGGFTTQKPPGDDPRHVCFLDSYRCAFSITRADGALWRHVSISIPAHGMFPNPFAVWMIVQEFGLTGWDEQSGVPPEDWQCKLSKEENCIIVAQKLEDK